MNATLGLGLGLLVVAALLALAWWSAQAPGGAPPGDAPAPPPPGSLPLAPGAAGTVPDPRYAVALNGFGAGCDGAYYWTGKKFENNEVAGIFQNDSRLLIVQNGSDAGDQYVVCTDRRAHWAPGQITTTTPASNYGYKLWKDGLKFSYAPGLWDLVARAPTFVYPG